MPAPPIRLAGPVYLAASATNIFTPPTSSQVTLRTYITAIWLCNTDTVTRTATMYIGGTGGSTGGTEILHAYSMAAGQTQPFYFGDGREMLTTDFLTGLADSASKVTIAVDGYVQAV